MAATKITDVRKEARERTRQQTLQRGKEFQSMGLGMIVSGVIIGLPILVLVSLIH